MKTYITIFLCEVYSKHFGFVNALHILQILSLWSRAQLIVDIKNKHTISSF